MAVNLSVRSITPELPARPRAASSTGRTVPLELEITETVGMEDADEALGRARGAHRARDPAVGRRLRDRLLLARLPQAAAGERDQDRPLVRHGDGPRRRATARSCAPRSTSPATSGWRSSPRAWRARRRSSELRALGCHLAQGFVISPPLPAPRAAPLARRRRLAAAAARPTHRPASQADRRGGVAIWRHGTTRPHGPHRPHHAGGVDAPPTRPPSRRPPRRSASSSRPATTPW